MGTILELLRNVKQQVKLIRLQKEWRDKNTHNFTTISRYVNLDKISCGVGSYGPLEVMEFGKSDNRLIIGNYCSIAEGVKFLLGGNHNLQTVTTYPFKHFYTEMRLDDALSKGDIILEDDVWIAVNCTILSGVTIHKGAVVSAGAVVTTDVPPYTIVGGVPARAIKKRFPDEIIHELNRLDLSSLTKTNIQSSIKDLYSYLTLDNYKSIIGRLRTETGSGD